MKVTINFKMFDYSAAGLADALAAGLGVSSDRVRVAVAPALSLIPFCAEWRVTSRCADLVAYVDGELLLLNII